MKHFKIIIGSLLMIFLFSCKEYKQNLRTIKIIEDYFYYVWNGDINKAESLIDTPCKTIDMDGKSICRDTIAQKKIIKENKLTIVNQAKYLKKKYNEKPKVKIFSAEERIINLWSNQINTGIIFCKVELSKNELRDTCFLMIYNGREGRGAIIAEMAFEKGKMHVKKDTL